MDIHWNHLNICGSILVDFVFKILLKQVVCITFYDFFYINSCKASIFHSLKQYPAQLRYWADCRLFQQIRNRYLNIVIKHHQEKDVWFHCVSHFSRFRRAAFYSPYWSNHHILKVNKKKKKIFNKKGKEKNTFVWQLKKKEDILYLQKLRSE